MSGKSGNGDCQCHLCSDPADYREEVDGKSLDLCKPCRRLLEQAGRVEGSGFEVTA